MTRITFERFAREYPAHLAQGMTQEQISLALGISRATLCRNIRKYDLLTQKDTNDTNDTNVSKKKKKEIQISRAREEIDTAEKQKAIKEGDARADTIIDTAYKTNMKAIQLAVTGKKWDKAASLSIDALRIARTIHDKERVVQALQIKIDARRQTVVVLGDLSVEDRSRLDRDALRRAFMELRTGGVCPMCGGACGEVIDVDPVKDGGR